MSIKRQFYTLFTLAICMVFMSSAHAYDCTNLDNWNPTIAYTGGKLVQHNSKAYKASHWTQGDDPESHSGPWEAWILLGACDGGPPPNIAPTASLTSPSNNASFSVGDNVTLSANAADSDGSVSKVEFYVDNIKVSDDLSSPYSVTWVATVGSHTIQAKAIDNLNAVGPSISVSITVSDNVNQLPTVDVTSPNNNASFSVGDNVTLSANAADSDGSVSKVEFYVDNIKVSDDLSAPYSVTWVATVGNHTIQAKAIDNLNAVGVSTSVSIVVTDNTNQSPVAELTSPANNATFVEGDSVALTANASDTDGSISKVEFYVDSTRVGEDTSSPYSINWAAVMGAHKIFARAIDNQNGSGDSTEVAVTVTGAVSGHEACRPDGLYTTPGVQSPYCTVYDQEGRENMGSDHARRIIGYFTSWRNGSNGQPTYLVNNIPWNKLTHINYAFAHVDGQNKLSIGDANAANNAATKMEWPGVAGAEMDPAYAYKGHFNLLNKFKKQYPNVKTLISVGGWAESGGYFDGNGNRVDSGGFYSMTTNADNSINTAGINTFADSAVAFIRQYGFSGVDIDYEYPTTMNDAGNPLDFAIANARRGGLNASYLVLMKALREKLDAAGKQDGKHYLLTIASPSSGYLLRGMEVFESVKYLDYVNVMTYDLHGAWNQFVGHNAALFDTGKDAELIAWNYYNTAQYQKIGYLNTDWAFHYFRGAVQAGRINLGVPYYTRGSREVVGGTNGLWGKASLPDQSKCPAGTGTGTVNDCGHGAVGIDNMWHDLDENGVEMGAGSNPMWHVKNLQDGRLGSYVQAYGLDPINNPDDQLLGNYQRYYDSVAVAPWLWNSTKKVFLSIEDVESINTKAQYVIDRGIGGLMFWELAGDYSWDAANNEYFMGTDMTTAMYNKFATATPYGNRRADGSITVPVTALQVDFNIHGFALGDNNYPITPTLSITNNTGTALPGGSQFQFDVPTAIPDSISDQSGAGLTVVSSGSNTSGNNIGGLVNNFHRVSIKLPGHTQLANGASWDVKLNYQLPMPTPSNWVLKVGTQTFALKQEYPQLETGVIDGSGPTDPTDPTNPPNISCASQNIDPNTVNVYPNWTANDHANGGDLMSHQKTIYRAKWWTNSVPGGSEWALVCTF